MELIQNFTQTKNRSAVQSVFTFISLSLFFTLVAWISIPLPFTPIPICFTTQLILFSSVFFGHLGTYATLLYLIEGAMGLPVFSNGGGGIAYLLGPTGGYVIGFAIASYVVATLSENLQSKTPTKIFSILLFGNALIYVFGLPSLGIFVGSQNALKFGLYPFIATDLFKLIVAQRALKKLKFFK